MMQLLDRKKKNFAEDYETQQLSKENLEASV